MKQTIVMIHGIARGSRHLEVLEAVLRPHFSCARLRYSDYDGSFLKAALKVVLRPGLKGKVLRRLRADFGQHSREGARCHVIAHSFGTYILGGLLQLHADVSRVVLVGSVLPRRFRWKRLNASRQLAFAAVRNEVARADKVSLLAMCFPGFGSSGRFGFWGPSDIVHNLPGPTSGCPLCRPPQPYVHNIELGHTFGHSDHFLSGDYATKYWLPFLWGIDAAEFQEFIELMSEAARLHGEREYMDLKRIDDALAQRRWSFFEHRTLMEYLRSYIAECCKIEAIRVRDAELRGMVDSAARGMCLDLRAAVSECTRAPGGQQDEQLASCLHPKHLIKRAAFPFIDEARRRA
jgi:pimeloyl-ACP methyl ester carboxylesterase